MGMCASQARLLTITSKKSDLELQAQKINNDRETLARQEEALMIEYSNKTGNRELKVKDGDSYVQLTSKGLFSMATQYKVYFNGNVYDDGEKLNKALEKAGLGSGDDSTGGEDNNGLQYALLNGLATLKRYDESKKDEKSEGWEDVSVAGDPTFRESYYSDDDAKAKAEYDLEMGKIQRKDKRLELNLDQIETEHKAAETEMESVQKVINNNIEKSFNAFDG